MSNWLALISDSFGRPWRRGTAGVAIGCAGLPSLIDLRGQPDLFGRILEVSIIGFADEIAAAASLLQGQAAEGQPVVVVRGLTWTRTRRVGRGTGPPAGRGSVPVIIALSGGVGGAKLALGLARVLPPEELVVVVNTGDDFEHLGLSISPDIDTVTYTLAGLANRELGWGRHDETWSFMETMEALGGETWFRLGDRDVALHVERTRRLNAGEKLSAITADFCRRLGIRSRVVPMSDDPVRTRLRTDEGWLDFQEYFVHRRCEPVVHELLFQGAGAARAHPEFLAALADPALQAIVICPSNPFISVEPILAIPGVRQAMIDSPAPIIAVSPIIAGQAVKGPTAKMMQELGLDPSAGTVAQRYHDLLDGYVIDHADMSEVVSIDARVTLAQTLMRTLEDREALARTVLDAAAVLRRRKRRGDNRPEAARCNHPEAGAMKSSGGRRGDGQPEAGAMTDSRAAR